MTEVVETALPALALRSPSHSRKRPLTEDDDLSDSTTLDNPVSTPKQAGGKRKIDIHYIQDKSKRHITFSKRKAGLLKKASELATLTNSELMLVICSPHGHTYSFATHKFQPILKQNPGKELIQACVQKRPDDSLGDEQLSESLNTSLLEPVEYSPITLGPIIEESSSFQPLLMTTESSLSTHFSLSETSLDMNTVFSQERIPSNSSSMSLFSHSSQLSSDSSTLTNLSDSLPLVSSIFTFYFYTFIVFNC
jgi:hypothetical protein